MVISTLLGMVHRVWSPETRGAKRGTKPPRRQLAVEVLETRTTPSVDVWTGAGHLVNNNWSNPQNWSLLAPPSPTDTALFDGTAVSKASVVDTAFSIASLDVSGSWNGEIGIRTALNLSATSDWDSGRIAPIALPLSATPPGVLVNHGLLRLNGGNVLLSGGGVLANYGHIVQGGTGNLYIAGNGTGPTRLYNVHGGSYSFLTDTSILPAGNGGGVFINAGGLSKAKGTGQSKIGVPLDNYGTVTAGSGTLNVTGPIDEIQNGTLKKGEWIVSSTPTTPATLMLSANITTIGPGVDVYLKGPHSSFPNIANLTTNLGVFALYPGASFATAGNFRNAGALFISPTSTLTVHGDFTSPLGTVALQVGGTSASPIIGSITATGTVTLGSHLRIIDPVSILPAIGSHFTILNNQGSSAVMGTFFGLAEGATFMVNTLTFQITYVGGDSNDVVITRTA